VNRRLLALYPRDWRERYGPEVASLADELISAGETTRLRAALDLIGGAAFERWRALTSRSVLVSAAVAMAAVGGVALAESYMPARLYPDTHPAAGLLLLAAAVGWLMIEVAEFRRGRHSQYWRDRTARTGERGFWLAVGTCAVAGSVLHRLAPLVVPAAAIRPGAVAFAAGTMTLVAGIGLRRWSFTALRGRYLTFAIVVSPDQPVVATGPYRLLRHPGHAGILLICIGAGLASANWASLAVEALPPLALIIWRVRAEEKALLATLGDRYRCYASDRRRLVPLVW
jgi:protein-S-isoprenylcysteine O-methyltransferase Ste14